MLYELYFIIKEAIYGTTTHFYFGHPRNAAEKLNTLGLDRDGVGLDYFTSTYGCVFFNGGENFVFLDQIPTQPAHFNALAHELYHLVNHIMDFVGIDYMEDEPNEARAYFMGYMTERVIERL